LSLRVRIALISAAAVAVAIAIAAVVTFNATERELIAEVDDSLRDRIEQIERAENPFELIALLGGFEERAGRTPFERGLRGFDAIFWQYVPDRGPAITDYPGEGGLPLGSAEQDVATGVSSMAIRTVNVGDDNLRVLSTTVPALPSGVLQVARSLAEVDSSLEGLASVLRLAAVVGVLLAGVVGYVVARGAARPIGELAEAAEHVAETQELAARIRVERSDEIGRLAESFNAMLAALEHSREQQRRLVRDAGHELRTPLTALRTNVELLGRVEDLPEDERGRMIEDIDAEIQELSLLVGELVELAAEPPSDDLVMETLDLGDVVERMAEKYRRRTGRSIGVFSDDSTVLGDTAQLERAVGNLVDNATKWSPEGSPIEIAVEQGRVTVSDQGPGIDDEDIPYVFDRFYRAAGARSRPGSGLGLSIVAKTAKDHGGSVFVADSATGAAVGFELPLAAAAPAES
jgi:two-component system sensor histidine kinase MprB